MTLKKFIPIIALLALVLLVSAPVTAVNMTITNFATGKQDLMIYTPNGTLIGLYNTSSPIIPLPETDFQVVLRPNTASTWVNNPLLFFNDAVGFILVNALPIFMIVGLLAFALALAGYGRRH